MAEWVGALRCCIRNIRRGLPMGVCRLFGAVGGEVQAYRGYGESHLTIDELRRFVRFGDTGVWHTYFTGVALPYRPGAVWEVAYELAMAGYLLLAQQRLTHAPKNDPKVLCGTFAYRLCRTSKPWREPDRSVRAKMLAGA